MYLIETHIYRSLKKVRTRLFLKGSWRREMLEDEEGRSGVCEETYPQEEWSKQGNGQEEFEKLTVVADNRA